MDHVAELLRRGREQAGLADFGEDSFREGLERLVDALDREARLNDFGRMAMDGQIVDLLVNRLQVENWYGRHPEIDDEAITAPLIGLGLPRTGYPVTPGLHKVERDGYFTADGFYPTGDLCLREGQRFHFVGRGGDMIKTAGSNVSPAEVEMEMQALDGVHSAYVVGLPDPQRGQIVAAAVVPVDGRSLDFADVEAQLRTRMSGYKVPRKYVHISRDEVPMLPSNKVAKREVAELIAQRLSAERG
jgi:acyl-CoA synthetase (AMP-forming)/AMP-acid ligase II